MSDQPAAMSSTAIQLGAVTKRFRLGAGQGITALDDVSLTIARGSVVALAGPSGSGKSTLLHLIGALERPDSGDVDVEGANLGALRGRHLAEHRRRVGFIFQRFNLLPALTALDNVLAPVVPYRTPYNKQQRARELLADVGLAGRERSLPSQLSGGQQQRVAIARALINAPQIVLADEPTGNLDSRTGREIISLLIALRDSHDVTVVIATHDPRVAGRCDRVIRLLDGRVADDIEISGDADVAVLLDDSP
jgi:putative ABC transport system ATP-binding protein